MKPRVLFVTHRVPWPPDRGDRIRTWNILRFLAERAHVDVACLADEPVSAESRRQLERVAARLAIVPHAGNRRYLRGVCSGLRGRSATEGIFNSARLRGVLRQWSRMTRWDGALASSSGVAQYIQPDVIPAADRRWVDLIDVDSQKWLDYRGRSRWPLSFLYGLEGRRLRRLECQLAASMDRLLVVSAAERDLLQSFCSADNVQAVGNGVDTQFFEPSDAVAIQPCTCVFVGVMNYLPNVDAVCWFADEVWPDVRKQFPEAEFRIVGKSPSSEVLRLAERDGIEVTGPVDDVRPYLHQANCVVVPLRIARGVQNKVLEAMACGRPIVCSPEPLKGLHVKPGLQLLQASAAAEWTQAIAGIFNDPCTAAELGLAAAATVQHQHRWESCLQPLRELLPATRITSPALSEVAT
jgi:sugar transferase (PEP-CTERM/EpsH1 system associated)